MGDTRYIYIYINWFSCIVPRTYVLHIYILIQGRTKAGRRRGVKFLFLFFLEMGPLYININIFILFRYKKNVKQATNNTRTCQSSCMVDNKQAGAGCITIKFPIPTSWGGGYIQFRSGEGYQVGSNISRVSNCIDNLF